MKNIVNNLNFIFMAKNIEEMVFQQNRSTYLISQSVIWIFIALLLISLISFWK